MVRIQVLALVAAVLGGCASTEYTKLLDRADGALQPGGVTLGVLARVQAGRMIQAVVSPYTSTDVDHVKVALRKQEADGTFSLLTSQETPAGSGLTKTVSFSHLKMNSTYKVAVTCVDSSGASLNMADGSGESTVSTTNNDYVSLSVTVNLKDKTFDGSLLPSIGVTSGSVVDTTDAEAGTVVAN